MTPKQQRFVEEYLLDLNAAAAAERAGYSKKTARSIGQRLLTNVDIQEAVQVAMAQRSERTLIDSDWVLKRLGQQADADMADLFDANGALKAVKDWPEVWRKGLIAGVEVFEEFIGQGEDRVSIGFTKKVKIADRLKNIELIGKHVRVGAFRDNVALTGSNGGPIQNVTMTQDQFKEIAKGIASEV